MSTRRLLLVVSAAASIALAGCGLNRTDVADTTDFPAHLEQVPGSTHPRIHLTQQAYDRLAIKLDPVLAGPIPPRPAGSATSYPALSPTSSPSAEPSTASPEPSSSPTPAPSPIITPASFGGPFAVTTPPPRPRIRLSPRPAPPVIPRPFGTDSPTPEATVRPGGLVTIPFAAILYDSDGTPYVYTSPEPLVFVWTPVTIAYVAGDVAVLSAGPPAGTQVVSVGGSELSGIEFRVNENEGG